MARQRETTSISNVIRIGGAFIAWLIGSGFATGQEVLQFFSSFGLWSIGVVVLSLAGFIAIGSILLTTGYEQRGVKPFNHFKYFCGEKLGAFYSWLIPLTLIGMMTVLVSGAGATLAEAYGIHHAIGSALMAGLVLCAYLIGFERLVRVVASIGPAIILFALLVGTLTLVRGRVDFAEIARQAGSLSRSQAAPHWLISAGLYLSLNLLTGSAYFIQLGAGAANRTEARRGALLGAAAFMGALAITNAAILLNAQSVSTVDIPMLLLAKRISAGLGGVFSLVLLGGMFSACSAMLWSVCSRFEWGGRRANQAFAAVVALLVFALSLFSFRSLLGVLYPLVGYSGLAFIAMVLYKGMQRRSVD